MTREMTAEEAKSWIETCIQNYINEDDSCDKEILKARDMMFQALEAQPKPMEKFDDVKTHIQRLAGDYKCWDNRLTWEEALELNRMLEAQPCEDCISREAVINTIFYKSDNSCDVVLSTDLMDRIKQLPSVTPRTNLARTSQDCISREAVLDVINFEDEWLFDAKSHNADTKIAFSAIKYKISELPSVTPQRPKGKWIRDIDVYRCNKCLYVIGHWNKRRYNYCPNCGAYMGGADE